MKNVFEFITNKRDYTLHFQNAEYTKNDFECFYSHEDVMGKEVEFLPGIFYKFELKRSVLLKNIVAVLCLYNGESQLIKLLPKILNEKFGKRIITIQFKNIRDSYSFFIDQEKVYRNEKNFKEKMKQNFSMNMNMLKKNQNT